MTRKIHTIVILAVLLLIQACTDNEQSYYEPQFSTVAVNLETEYIFGVHPLHNPQRLHEVFNPLMDYLSANIDNAHFKLEASRNYAAFDEKLYSKKFHFALPNPYQTINAIDKGYRVIAKMGDDENFRGIILVRKDSGITKVTDLVGKAVSYPAPTALAATMMPQFYLQTHGIDVMTDLDNRYVGSQESSVMNVYLKQTSAGATWPPPWRALIKQRPELEKELMVIWETPPLPNNSIVVLPSIADELSNEVSRLLVNLHKNSTGQKILSQMELSEFEKANNNNYQAIRDFVKDFSDKVRVLE